MARLARAIQSNKFGLENAHVALDGPCEVGHDNQSKFDNALPTMALKVFTVSTSRSLKCRVSFQ